MNVKSKLSSASVQTAAGIVLALFLLWLLFRGTDLGAVRHSLLGADPLLIFLAVVTTFSQYVVRALRWQVLLAPLGRPSLSNCFGTTVIGFTVNFLVPSRLGEIARPYLLARREGFSASGAFATVLLERVLDLITVLLLIGFWLVVAPPASEEAVLALKVGGLFGLGVAFLAFAVMLVLARSPEPSLARIERIVRLLPERAARVLMRFFETFATGLRVLVDPWRMARTGLLSLLLWLNIALAFWLGALALDVRFPFGDTFLVIGFLTVGVAVPTPGAAGGYHVLCKLALMMLFQTEASLAIAVALVNHAIAFVPVTFLGIALFARAGLSFKTLTSSS